MRDYIPISKDDLPEQFEFDLADESFILGFNYNETYDFFSCDLYDLDMNPIVLGEKLVINQPLWADITNELLPKVQLIPMDESNNEEEITKENFMVSTFLFIDDISDEEAAGLSEDGNNG